MNKELFRIVMRDNGRFVAIVAGLGRNKFSWDATHSERTAKKYAKELNARNDGYQYCVESQFGD